LNFLLEYTKVVVIGGTHSDYGLLSSVELLDMSEERRTCPELPDYPKDVLEFTAAFYDNSVIVCGGNLGFGLTDKCFSLGPDLSSWHELSTPLPNGPRFAMSSSIIDDKWYITGGEDDDFNHLNTTLIYDGVDFLPGPDMPFSKDHHCQLTVNSTHVFLLGGGAFPYLLNWETKEFTVLEVMPVSQTFPACGVLNNENYGTEILMAQQDVSFVFSFEDLKWREGPKIPDKRYYPASVPTKNGFLAIGGNIDDESLTSIYKFDDQLYKWISQSARLQIGRKISVAVTVSDDFANCT